MASGDAVAASGLKNGDGQSEAVLLNGTAFSKQIKATLKEKISALVDDKGVVPGLAIVQVGDREDSTVYIGMKLKSAAEVGIKAQHVKLPSSTTEKQLLDKLDNLNEDRTVHGIILQLPLDTVNIIDSAKATNRIVPEKDVDGLSEQSAGRLSRGDVKDCFMPCTPRGIIELIKSYDIEIAGKNAVVIGRSRIVGMPMSELLIWNNATVTVCHSKTRNIKEIVSQADILVVAIGSLEYVKGSWIKPGCVVIDCGINAIPDDTKKSGRRLVGDVEFEVAKSRASYITPVPGGVGPMTVATLMLNTYDAAVKMN